MSGARGGMALLKGKIETYCSQGLSGGPVFVHD